MMVDHEWPDAMLSHLVLMLLAECGAYFCLQFSRKDHKELSRLAMVLWLIRWQSLA